MNREYIEFHVRKIAPNCHCVEQDELIEWFCEYIKWIEKNKEEL
jgi:hypothetical protein